MKSLSVFHRLLFALSLASVSLAPALRATALEHDLQQGLAYVRVNDLTSDQDAIEKNLNARPALVLDLRHVTADDETAATLVKLLAHPPVTPRFVRMLLVSETTAPALLKQLSPRIPGVVTLAAKTDTLTPDITVATTADEDRLAYDALTAGVSFDKLLSGTTPQKIRYDEASLVRDHANGTTRSQPADEPAEESPEPAADTSASSTKPEKPAPQPVDRVLLRAVQLHRALLALKKV